MSIGARVPIVATVVTLLFVPIMNKAGHVVGHRIISGPEHTLRCVEGKPIAGTPLAKRLNLVGTPCTSQIVRKVRVAPAAR